MSGVEIVIEYFIILAGGVAFFAGLYQLTHYRDAIAKWSGFVMLGISINLFCYVALKMDLLPEVGRFLFFIQIISYLLLDISYLVFVVYFAGRSKWINKWSLMAFVSIPLLIVLLLVAQWQSIPTAIPPTGNSFGVEIGMVGVAGNESAFQGAFKLFVVYSAVVGILSLILLISMYSNTPMHYRKTVLGVFLGNVLISATGIIEIFGANPFSQVSILQFGVALASIPIFLIVFSWKDIRSIPINHKLLKDALRNGYLILDPYEKVVDFNAVMGNILGGDLSKKSGSQLSDLISESRLALHKAIQQRVETQVPELFETQNCLYQVNVVPIEGERKEFVGTLVVFQNISDREILEERLFKQQQSIVQTNTLLSGLAEANLNIQTTDDISNVYQILSTELKKIDLNCFVLNPDPGSSELVIRHISSQNDKIAEIEKNLGFELIGFPLDRRTFPQIYSYLKRSAQDCSATKFRIDQAFGGVVPAKQIEQAFKIIGIELDTPVIVLQLNAGKKILGLLGVWGKELETDSLAALRIFASQVAWALQRINLFNRELKRSTELARSNQLITALANVTAQLGATDDSSKALVTLGDALEKINLHCLMGTVDANGEIITFKYASFYHRIRTIMEKIPGFEFIDYQLPKRLWPGSKVVKEGVPVWYHNPIKIFGEMFPMLAKNIIAQGLKRIGVSSLDNLCILPLIIDGKVNGILAVWGTGIQEDDTPTLMVFAHQVAENLRKTKIYEDELARADNLDRTNKMIIALSNVAAQLETTSILAEVYETLSGELIKVDLDCLICKLDESKQKLKIEYSSVPNFNNLMARFGIHKIEDLYIPRKLWPSTILEKKPIWEPDLIEFAGNIVPFGSTKLFQKVLEKNSINLDHPACFLPMIIDEGVIGMLIVRGPNLTKDDIPSLSVFANQVATAINNTTLYNQAQKEIQFRTKAEASLQEALSEKEVLLKEIHHRVKNNLQVISSLLSLQIRQSGDQNNIEGLLDSQNRVRAMALIHEKLYQSDDLAQINFTNYLRSLTSFLTQTYRIDAHNLSVEVQADQIMLDLDTAVPCGLIVNELVTNSLKYAFPDGKTGTVQVACQQTDRGQYNLVVSDSGVGLPKGFNLDRSTSLGLRLVSNLVKQIDGQVIMNGSPGTRIEIRFPQLKPEV